MSDKVLVRAFSAQQSDVEVISSTESTKVALEQIADIAVQSADENDSTHLIEGFADILALMHSVMKNKNINPDHLFSTVTELQQSKGTFDLNTISKEQ